MSLKATNLIKPNTYEVLVESTAEEFEDALQKTFLKQRKRINVPGFRKGKATRKMIEKLYGETVFYDDAINSMVPVVVAPAVEEAGLELVATPAIDVTSISRENGVAFTVTCIVKPEITVSSYKGIEAEKFDRTVTDEDVDKALEDQRRKNARIITVEDRAAENGDTADIDYEGFIDGKAFEGGKEKGHSLKLGSKSFIPGFEEQIVGHTVGEEFAINVTFPEGYPMEEIAGKNAEFKIRLNGLTSEELPELDDDFAMDVSEFDTLEEFKKDIRANLEAQLSQRAQSIISDRVLTKLAENVEGEIPVEMYESRIDRMVDDFNRRIQGQGISPEMYYSFSGIDEKKQRETYRPQAEVSVKVGLALEYIAKTENLEVSQAEIDAEYEKLAKDAGITADKAKAAVPADVIKEDLLKEKAQKLVIDNAVLTDPAPAEEKAAE